MTKSGIRKGYGNRKFEDFVSIPLQRVIVVGATSFLSRNDDPAEDAGMPGIS